MTEEQKDVYKRQSHCSEVWVFGEIVSAGMDAEIRRAKRKNYRLRYLGSDLKEAAR